jgi:hypothetical protein
MRWSRLMAVPAVLGLAACSETGVEVADLVGTWDATKFEFIDAAGGDPVLTFDVILVDGTVVIVFGADNTYEVTVTLPFSEPEVETGTWAVDGNELTLTSGGVTTEVTVLEVELTGTTLNVTAEDLEFDIDEDGTDDPVLLEATFVKR